MGDEEFTFSLMILVSFLRNWENVRKVYCLTV